MTDESLAMLCKDHTSISGVMSDLGYKGGSGHAAVKARIADAKIDISHFTGKTWNKGLTKETDLRVKANGLASSLSLMGRPGRPHSLETREKQSRTRTAFLESHGDRRTSWYEVPCGSEVKKVQGTWERRVATWLNESHIKWDRVKLTFGHRSYTPDFYLTDHGFYIEVKGFWSQRDLHKMFLVLEHNDVDIRIVDKFNINELNINLPKFVDTFSRELVDTQKFRNVWSSDVMAAM